LAYSRKRVHGQEEDVVARQSRDVERIYETDELVAKLRRLADALETGSPFRIQIAGERIRVPARAEFSIEHERGDDEEEIEFQFKWTLETEPTSTPDDEPMV
jgi:amphi-Trp domain-containing protein